MRQERHQRFLSVTTVLVLVLLSISGCAGSKSAAPDSGQPASSSGSAYPARVVISQGADPTSLDPHSQRETTTVNVLVHLYDSLWRRDNKDLTKYNPILAESWKFVDRSMLEVKLKQGVKFANGEVFDANAVKFNLDRLIGKEGPKPLLAYQFTTIKETQVVDANTVRIITTAPDPILVARLATAMMVPPKLTREQGKDGLNKNPAGTGPYTLKSWVPNDKLVLTAKPDYHRGKAPVEEVVFRPIPEGATRVAELEAGNVDIIVNVTPDSIKEIEASGKALVKPVPSTRVAEIFLNTLDYPQFKDKRIRQALNYAVDVDSIVANVVGGYGLRVPTIVAPYFTGGNSDLKPYPYNPDKAKQLLAEAGYPNGFEMELMVPQGRYFLGVETSQAVAGYLAKVGVKVKLNVVEFGVFASLTQKRDIKESFYASWGFAMLNPVDAYGTLVVTGKDGYSWYSNPKVDDLYLQAASTVDEQKHVDLLHQIEKELYDDPPFIYLFAQKDLYGVSKSLNWSPRGDEQINIYDVGK